ncbi:hypothetical protein [Actinoplanes solisilvae]|uniref:hypothetical protein n=1 Tax=Actinoplanes solisilvae TaxID=2486853 RepID=UPI000FDB6E5C|nr:hypothetical protein [Actinoplanes solisilvae]
MTAIVAAVEQGRAGDRAGARQALEALWDQTGDVLHRCTIAHFAADLQDSVADELRWDELALAEAGSMTEERIQQYDAAWQVRQLLPSLHLNLADAHRRSGNFAAASSSLKAALAEIDSLPDNDYGTLIRVGAEKIERALAEKSVAPLV